MRFRGIAWSLSRSGFPNNGEKRKKPEKNRKYFAILKIVSNFAVKISIGVRDRLKERILIVPIEYGITRTGSRKGRDILF